MENSNAAAGRGELPRLAVIATAAGAFSGLFGVGGGTIIVPLLIFWFGFGERLATGTSSPRSSSSPWSAPPAGAATATCACARR
jgi:uncharacterized membrane protein YfcA